MRRALLLICIPILAGCSSEPFKPSTDQRNEAFEVFFSALIASNGSASMARKSAIVLCFPKHTDPDPEFLSRFSSRPIPILPCSAATRGPRPTNEVILISSGGPAIELRVDAAYFSSDSQVAVEGGYAEATLSFASYRLEMKKRHGVWVIEKRETFGVG